MSDERNISKDEENVVSSNENTASTNENATSSNENTASNNENAASSNENAASNNEENAVSSNENTASNNENVASSNENATFTNENAVTTNEKKQGFIKRHKKLTIIFSIIFTIAIICTCLILFVPVINNYVCLKVMSPKKYMEKVEKKDAQVRTEKLKNLKLFKKMSENNKKGNNLSYEIKISDECKNIVKDNAKSASASSSRSDVEATDFLLSVIESIDTITTDSYYKEDDDTDYGTFTLKLNNNDTIQMNSIINKKDNVSYLQIPTISQKWLSIKSLDELLMSYSQTNPEFYTEKFGNILSNYTSIAFENFENVTKKENVELTVNNNSKKCTLLESILTDEEATKIVLKILNEAKEDKDLYELIKSGNPKLSSDDYKKEIDKMIEDIKKDENNPARANNELHIKLWVDNAGNVVAYDLTQDDFSITFQSIMTENDKNFYAFYIKDKNEKLVSLEGSNIESKDKADGDMKITIHNDNNKEKEFVFDFEYKDITTSDEGITDGNMKIQCDQLYGLKFDTNFSVENSEQKTDSTLHFMGINCGTINSSSKTGENGREKIEAPKESIELDLKNTNEYNDKMNEYIDSISLDTLGTNLKTSLNNNDLSVLIDLMVTNTDEFKEILRETLKTKTTTTTRSSLNKKTITKNSKTTNSNEDSKKNDISSDTSSSDDSSVLDSSSNSDTSSSTSDKDDIYNAGKSNSKHIKN